MNLCLNFVLYSFQLQVAYGFDQQNVHIFNHGQFDNVSVKFYVMYHGSQ
jgi:hypothetical protein